MENGVIHLQNKTTLANIYQRSPAIWGHCPLAYIKKYYPESWVRWDASRMSLAGTQTTQIAGPIPGTKVFASSGGAVDAVSAVNSVEKWGGAIQFGVDTDDESASLAQAYPTFRVSGDKDTDNPLFFEGCVSLSSIATNTVGIFMGLAETELWTLAAGVPFNAGDAITNSASAIGWRKEEDGLGVWDTVVSDRATSFTNVGDAAVTVSAANTFIKLGMLYNPLDKDRCVRFFADNIEMTTALTRAAVQAYTNLDANAVGPLFALIADSGGTAVKAHLKWLEVAQLPPQVKL